MSEISTEEAKIEELKTDTAADAGQKGGKEPKKKPEKVKPEKVKKPAKEKKPLSEADVRKMFIISMAVSTVVIIALIAVILYLLRDSLPFGNGGQTGADAQEITLTEEEVSTQSAAEPEEETAEVSKEETETPDPEDADIDLIRESAEEVTARPEGWYGSFESSGPMDGSVPLDSYRSVCPDIYAWIEIPGTDIDDPIAYCEDSDDPFYFTHDMEGNPSEKGMIITDSLNGRDFSDPVTLIYGHNPKDGTLFAQLQAFRDADFFDKHDTINIYVDDAELVYKVYACYIGSSDHILMSNDFGNPESFADYFDSVKDVRDLSLNIRQEAKPAFNDHVITLVTHCDDDAKRLFVHAVLEEVRY